METDKMMETGAHRADRPETVLGGPCRVENPNVRCTARADGAHEQPCPRHHVWAYSLGMAAHRAADAAVAS